LAALLWIRHSVSEGLGGAGLEGRGRVCEYAPQASQPFKSPPRGAVISN
jgi:hypothetical protein